jgi:hypothetical protein
MDTPAMDTTGPTGPPGSHAATMSHDRMPRERGSAASDRIGPASPSETQCDIVGGTSAHAAFQKAFDNQ